MTNPKRQANTTTPEYVYLVVKLRNKGIYRLYAAFTGRGDASKCRERLLKDEYAIEGDGYAIEGGVIVIIPVDFNPQTKPLREEQPQP
jgi:hypothetical protein